MDPYGIVTMSLISSGNQTESDAAMENSIDDVPSELKLHLGGS